MCLRCADALSEGFGVLAKAPSGKRDFQAMQEAFNRWEEQSGLDLTSISRTLERLVRPGFIFGLAPGWPGVLEHKKARLIVVSRDSYIPGEPSESADLVTPVLRKVLDFMGIHEVDVARAGGSLAVNLGRVRLEDHLAKYEAQIAALAQV